MALKNPPYNGFEQGPIRPPSEAQSLLLRITRNCPWNRCTFCYIYKHDKFSIRPVDDIKKDIDMVYRNLEAIRTLADANGTIYREDISHLAGQTDPNEIEAFNAALNWYTTGMESIFLQDANSLVIKPDYMVEILEYIKAKFPQTQRITSYARSHSLARISDENFTRLRKAGLNRIHVGLETGSDILLKLVQKGSSKEQHIIAGQKVKQADIELSEYIMPGIGGKDFSEENALETADALNQIDPDFIRIRTTTLPTDYPLFKGNKPLHFTKMKDLEIIEELRILIKALEGITSTLKSDHMMNLLQTLEGRLPNDKGQMLSLIERFLNGSDEDKLLFQIGRRFGFLFQPDDLKKKHLKNRCLDVMRQYRITTDNVDDIIEKHIHRGI